MLCWNNGFWWSASWIKILHNSCSLPTNGLTCQANITRKAKFYPEILMNKSHQNQLESHVRPEFGPKNTSAFHSKIYFPTFNHLQMVFHALWAFEYHWVNPPELIWWVEASRALSFMWRPAGHVFQTDRRAAILIGLKKKKPLTLILLLLRASCCKTVNHHTSRKQ